MTRARQWSVLTAVACLAVMAAGWFILVKPQRTHAASLRDQASQVDQSNQALQSQIAHLRAQARDLPAQQRTLAKIATQVPDSPALPTLIRQLSAAADGAGVNLVSLAPGQPGLVQSSQLGAAKPSGPSPAVTSTAPGAVLASIPLQIQVQGTYFNLEQFFQNVESLPRSMAVSQFSAAPIVPGANPSGQTVAPGTLNVTLTASVFMSPGAAATTGK
ncbi:MAG: hypothetical protein QOC82_607 [Frankiaceae bacterium]|jgi:Tfp pilus assembly protein PilO|nr:hypothetical protein [Frankiaceae bacterium]